MGDLPKKQKGFYLFGGLFYIFLIFLIRLIDFSNQFMGICPQKSKSCGCKCQHLFGKSFDPLQPEIWAERLEEVSCCGLKYKKLTPKKISFEQKFSRMCDQIGSQFQWVQQMKLMVSDCKIPKGKFLTQINELKKEVFNKVTTENPLQDSEELAVFKRKLYSSLAVTIDRPNYSSSLRNSKSSKIRSSMSNSGNRSRVELARYKKSGAFSVFERRTGKSIASVADQTFSEIFGGQKSVSKSTSHQLSIFLKLTSLLELHLRDTCCILGRILRFFITHAQKASNPISQVQISHFVDSTNQFLLLFREAVIDYYSLRMFRMKQIQNNFIANDQNILSIVTTVLFKDQSFYRIAFSIACQNTQQADEELEEALERIRELKPEDFTVKRQFCLNEKTIKGHLKEKQSKQVTTEQKGQFKPYEKCIRHLGELTRNRSPISKMKIIVACSECITQEIQNFYSIHGIPKEQWLLDADQVLSIFCFIIAKARIPHLHAHLFLLEHFSTNHQMMSMSGYYVSVVTSAVQQLLKEDINESSLLESVS